MSTFVDREVAVNSDQNNKLETRLYKGKIKHRKIKLRSCTGDLMKVHFVQLLIMRVPILVGTNSAYKPATYLPQYILPLMQNIHVLG